MTTGSFSVEARREAVRDGVPPIELVDSEKVIEMFEQLELGLRQRTTFDVDPEFSVISWIDPRGTTTFCARVACIDVAT